MLEIGALAATVVASFLTPWVKEGAEKLAEKLRKETTEAAADGLVATAKRLWDKVRGKAAESGDGDVVDLFEKKPDTMKASMEDVLRQLLESDPGFRAELSQLVETKEAGSPSWQLMGTYVAAVDARYATVSDNATVAGMIINPGPTATKQPADQPAID